MSLKLLFLFLYEISAALTCYECLTAPHTFDLSHRDSETPNCSQTYHTRQCSEEYSASECFTIQSKKLEFEAKGCVTNDMLKYKLMCQETEHHLDLTCRTCRAHVCNHTTKLSVYAFLPTFLFILLQW